MLGRAIGKNSALLGVFAIVTTAAIAGTYLLTRDAIAEQERAARARALLQVVPPARHDNDMLDDTLPVSNSTDLHLEGAGQIFVARMHGKPVAFIIPAIAPDGYGGPIKLIVGVNVDGTVAGVRAVAENETPGLGDQVDIKKSNWVLEFNGKSIGDPPADKWKVRKDQGVFDQFTGATITPRAVTGAVYRTLAWFGKHREELLAAANKADAKEHHDE